MEHEQKSTRWGYRKVKCLGAGRRLPRLPWYDRCGCWFGNTKFHQTLPFRGLVIHLRCTYVSSAPARLQRAVSCLAMHDEADETETWDCIADVDVVATPRSGAGV